MRRQTYCLKNLLFVSHSIILTNGDDGDDNDDNDDDGEDDDDDNLIQSAW